MPAARYWRAVGGAASGGDNVALSAFHLYQGSSAADSNYASVVTLLHADGTDGGTTLVDNAASPKTYTAFGDAQISTSQSRFGGASMRFDGSGDYFLTSASSDFAFSGDFTIEWWAWKSANGIGGYDTVATTDTSNGSGVNGWIVELSASRGFFMGASGSPLVSASSVSPNDSTWHHYAISRVSGVVRAFVDGALVSTISNSASIPASGGFGIGRNAALTSYPFNGFIDDFRITNGVGRYVTAFSPPTAAFPNGTTGTPTRADESATLTSTIPFVSGAASDLQDTDTSTTAVFDPRPAGFALVWDFGTDVEVDAIRLGSGLNRSEFLSRIDLQYLTNDSGWVTAGTFGQFVWPGANAFTGIPSETEPFSHKGPTPSGTLESFWSEAIVGSVAAAPSLTDASLRDMYLAGRGSINATVKEDGTPTDTPVRRKVRLFRDRDGLMVRETWSNATTGAYSFTEIDENETYSVVSYDHNNNFRAVIADRITPTVP